MNRFGEGLGYGDIDRPFIGTVNADGQVRLTMLDENLTGTLSLPSIYDIEQKLTLTYVTGPHTGDTIYFHFRSGY